MRFLVLILSVLALTKGTINKTVGVMSNPGDLKDPLNDPTPRTIHILHNNDSEDVPITSLPVPKRLRTVASILYQSFIDTLRKVPTHTYNFWSSLKGYPKRVQRRLTRTSRISALKKEAEDSFKNKPSVQLPQVGANGQLINPGIPQPARSTLASPIKKKKKVLVERVVSKEDRLAALRQEAMASSIQNENKENRRDNMRRVPLSVIN